MNIRKSLLLPLAQKYSALVIHTISVMVLARLLTPPEIGVYSVGAAVAGMAHVLRDFGVSSYLIQEKELTTDRIQTALGVALAIAWTIAVALFAVSDPVSRFYDEPGLRQVLRVLSLTFLIIPFNSPVLALLRRDKGYRGHDAPKPHRVFKSGQKRGVHGQIRRELRRRSAIEAVIGHCKTDDHLGRNFLKGRDGDQINAVMSAVGYNLRLILRWFRDLLRKIIAAIWAAKIPLSTLKSAS